MTITTSETDGAAPFGTALRVALHRLGGVPVALRVLFAVAPVMAAGMFMAFAFAHSPRAPQPVADTYRSTLDGPISLAPPGPDASRIDSRLILQDLLTRAGLRPHFDVHRLSWVQARKINALMPIAGIPTGTAKPFMLDVSSKEGAQALQCLTQAAYYEAGGNGADAEAAVVQVVLNRARHPDFPKSVCGVVYQGATHEAELAKGGCQFTFTCDGALSRPIAAAEWQAARGVALRALSGYVEPKVGASTYYHADYVFPAWAPGLVKTATVGPHIFYRMSGELGEASALTGRYAGGEVKVAREMIKAADIVADKAVKLASAGKAERTTDGRVHLQMGTEAASEDMKLRAERMMAAPEAALTATPAAPAA